MKTLIALSIFLCHLTASAQFNVSKVEPPNWWKGMKWNQVQIMVYGNDLNNLTAEFQGADVSVDKIHELENSDYAFIDITIPETVKAGKDYKLILRSGKKKLEFPFPIFERVPDPKAHQGFSSNDIIYLITPDRFANGDVSNDKAIDPDDFDRSDPSLRHGGDIQGMIDNLDYIHDLGFTAIWPNPLLENNQPRTYHGYAWTDLYKIDPRFGSNELFRSFVKQAHEKDIKVIFDHINNHIGIGHPWMQNLPMSNWINGTVDDHLNNKHNMVTIHDPHRAPSTLKEFKTFWFVDEMPDVNQNNPFVSKYYIQNTLWWIEYSGIDGIREDTYPYGFQEHSNAWAKAILQEYPDFNIVGESWLLKPSFVARFQDVKGDKEESTYLPSLMDFPLMHELREFIKGERSLYDIYMLYAIDFVYPDPDNLVVMMDNHDESRALFIADGDDSKVKLALQMVLTTRGIPQILYGTEINMLGGASHVLLRQDFPGGFPGDTRNAFTEAGRTEDENQMYSYLKQLIGLRNTYQALSSGEFIHYPPTDVYTYFKIGDEQTIMGAINGSSESKELSFNSYKDSMGDAELVQDLFSGEKYKTDSSITLTGHSGRLFLLIE